MPATLLQASGQRRNRASIIPEITSLSKGYAAPRTWGVACLANNQRMRAVEFFALAMRRFQLRPLTLSHTTMPQDGSSIR